MNKKLDVSFLNELVTLFVLYFAPTEYHPVPCLAEKAANITNKYEMRKHGERGYDDNGEQQNVAISSGANNDAQHFQYDRNLIKNQKTSGINFIYPAFLISGELGNE